VLCVNMHNSSTHASCVICAVQSHIENLYLPYIGSKLVKQNIISFVCFGAAAEISLFLLK